MTLRVVEAGLYSMMVDQGRPGYRSLGVPVGGAADFTSLALGNALVGNPAEAPALEVCLAGPTFQARQDVACVLFGAPFSITRNGRSLPPRKTFTLNQGDELIIGSTPAGMRAYFCVRGGFNVPAILGSHSGLEPITNGNELSCSTNRIHSRYLNLEASLPDEDPTARDGECWLLRVLSGLQADWFSEDEFDRQEYCVTPSSNRMGLRLQGQALTPKRTGREMTSEPVCPGAVQVTNDGQCIVLGVDGQTIGGYPKIAQVIQADLDRLGQMRPGDHLRFVQVDLDEAAALYRKKQQELEAWIMRLRTSLDGFLRESM